MPLDSGRRAGLPEASLLWLSELGHKLCLGLGVGGTCKTRSEVFGSSPVDRLRPRREDMAPPGLGQSAPTCCPQGQRQLVVCARERAVLTGPGALMCGCSQCPSAAGILASSLHWEWGEEAGFSSWF